SFPHGPRQGGRNPRATARIQLPGVGESITEGILARWLKPDGPVAKWGEPLFELKTDKASRVIPAPSAATLKIAIPEGTTVAIGATVGTLDPSGAAAAATPSQAPAEAKAEAPAPARTSNGGTPPPPGLSPAVRRIVEEEHVDANQIDGSGR